MNDWLVYGLIVGLAVGGFIFAALSRPTDPIPARRALAVASFGVGTTVCWWMYKHSSDAESIARDVAKGGIGVVLAALATAVLIWKVRSWL